MTGTPVLVANWLTVAGSISATIGSGMRAWFTLKEYRDLLQKLGQETTESLFRSLAPWSVWTFFPGGVVSVVWASLAIKRSIGTLLRSDDGRRMAELINQAAAWELVMLGAFLASASSLIRAVSAH
jgi:hypothetical protein